MIFESKTKTKTKCGKERTGIKWKEKKRLDGKRTEWNEMDRNQKEREMNAERSSRTIS